MKKIIVKDYEALEEKLRNADENFKNSNFENTIIMTENYQVGKTWDDYYMIRTDVQKLAKQLIVYFMETSKGFEFIEFHDKAFMDAFKGLIKNEEEFSKFLSMISLQVDDFLRLCIYICPLCFTILSRYFSASTLICLTSAWFMTSHIISGDNTKGRCCP